MKFEIFEDRAGEYRWRLRARNGEPMARGGEGFTTKRSCLRSVERIKEEVASAEIEVLED